MQTSLPTVTVLKPIIAMALGLTAYRETLHVGRATAVLLLASLAAMVAATIALGRLAAPRVDAAPAS